MQVIKGVGTVRCVSHPTAGLHLVRIETPELEFFFKKRSTNVRWVVQFASAIVVEYLGEDARMSIEKVFVKDRVVVDECLGET